MFLKFFFFLSLFAFWSEQTFSQKLLDGSWKSPQSLTTLNAAPVALIPFPQKVTWSKEKFNLPKNIEIIFLKKDSVYVKYAVQSLQQILSANGVVSTKRILNIGALIPANSVFIQIDNNLTVKSEGYKLIVSKNAINISGKDQAGAYYGVQTFRQLIEKYKQQYFLNACTIIDWPAFQFRAFMHDNGRNFQSIEMLQSQIDTLSYYKFNKFHWHLTDNPAWRIESKIYPQLNDPKNRKPGRDPEKTYSFNDIRYLIHYAKERNVTIIPELDMPGHSAFFEKAFGFKMGSDEGMKILEKLIDEFCNEIPSVDCPIIHLGSDEVHIKNPKEFIERMSACVQSHGRKVMIWNPGLPAAKGIIEQVWYEERAKGGIIVKDNPLVDSYSGYLNNYDALSLIQRYFFHQICNQPDGDSMALGGTLCCWPDTRVDNKQKILLYNPVWPGAITYSEALWCGRPENAYQYMNMLPSKNSEAGKYFHEFETRLAKHRDHFFTKENFPYVQFGNIDWRMTDIFSLHKGESFESVFSTEEISKKIKEYSEKTRLVTGGVLRLDGYFEPKKLSNDSIETIYLTTYLFSKESKKIYAWLGFETPTRSNRRCAGIPQIGKWDANGGTIWVNDKVPEAPKWENPGAYQYLKATWETPANEIPYTDEEFYWTRKPATIYLKSGWNKIVIRVPRTYNEQAWMSAFIPVKLNGNGKWVEDGSVKFDANHQ
ncbi:beta-hexosaminidase [mine drainage metagenome]|uniref:beta-N-acetylhexosaminidase n=1 Tax=mine drainage metagenome TaxID=410659 RepID=A0A1J5SUJ3_9ZZZZ